MPAVILGNSREFVADGQDIHDQRGLGPRTENNPEARQPQGSLARRMVACLINWRVCRNGRLARFGIGSWVFIQPVLSSYSTSSVFLPFSDSRWIRTLCIRSAPLRSTRGLVRWSSSPRNGRRIGYLDTGFRRLSGHQPIPNVFDRSLDSAPCLGDALTCRKNSSTSGCCDIYCCFDDHD
ncbi:hypothetical protein ASPVEDRAFT_655988 [Aspergillus versicolor CBS 583.65]|uniref:Uncharacterized protein n=1 Tax=Aspergillus versicolor CBS 583.65 TaxID=1036611 RepID=A0A1L9PKU7_ASPVE|nr:uncharacterized protein ASPVEDRAFT_655988 [Aspergillus versicolor CBS 583.65]OJJ02102.1 hypothetical protein ASPVEDRAFT_655988 [Aspergillus versicolor CBS 583.65]